MGLLDLLHLSPLMHQTAGEPESAVGLIDGPIWLNPSDLSGQQVHAVSKNAGVTCSRADSYPYSSCGISVTVIVQLREEPLYAFNFDHSRSPGKNLVRTGARTAKRYRRTWGCRSY